MNAELARAHILGQQHLRDLIVRAVAVAWVGLPGYDEADVAQFLATAVPIVTAGQRQSVALTEAFLAAVLGRQPLGVNPDRLMGSAVRAGADPEQVYRRPFVTVWTALKAGTEFDQAVHAGLERATSTAATDVQLSMRETLREVGAADERIVGYQRVPDGGACEFCRLVSGQRYRTDQLMPIHNRCGCGVDPILRTERHRFTGNTDNDIDGVAVREHGELGPVLTDPAHDFTSASEI